MSASLVVSQFASELTAEWGGEWDAIGEASELGRAIRTWARAYATRYHGAPDPKPSLEDAREDLRQWTTLYCGLTRLQRAGLDGGRANDAGWSGGHIRERSLPSGRSRVVCGAAVVAE